MKAAGYRTMVYNYAGQRTNWLKGRSDHPSLVNLGLVMGSLCFFPLRSGFFLNSWLWKMMNMDHLFGWSRWFIHWKSGDSDRSAISWLHVFMSCGELIGSIWMIYVYRYTTTKVISDGGIWTSPKHRHGMWHFFANNDLFTLITS